MNQSGSYEEYLRDEGLPELERYHIESRLGAGGMAVVYRALDCDLGRPVAIKFLHPDAGGGTNIRERFLREARVAASLAHPNVVTIHDVGETRTRLFIVMELVEGPTLSELIASRELSLQRSVELVEKAARGAGAAHALGIIHRDLKPANILMTSGGEPKVTDFGLARVAGSESGLTRTGAALGTPRYMSPEQVEGSKAITPAADVFALGVILYEATTHKSPHAGESIGEIYGSILSEEPLPPRRLNPAIDPDLQIIILKCLDKEADRRYPDATKLADDLRRYLEGKPIEARPPSALHQLIRFVASRKTWMVALAGVLALASLAVLVVPRWLREKRERERIEREKREEILALKELDSLWTEVLLAREGFCQAGENPRRIRERIEGVIDRVSGYIDRHPRHPQAYYVRAWARFSLESFDETEKDLLAAVEIDDQFVPGQALLARVKLQIYVIEIYGEPATYEDRVREKKPLLDEAKRRLAQVGTEPVSMESWGLMRTREDEVSAVMIRAMSAHFSENDVAKAIRILEEADRQDPSEQFRNLRGNLTSSADERIKWQTLALERMPHFAKALLDRGVALRANGKLNAARRDFDKAIEISPRLSQAYLNRGSLREEAKDTPGALADYAKALEIDPKSAETWHNRGVARLHRGDAVGAVEDFGKAIELRPRFPEAYLNRALAREKSGDADGAIQDFTRALDQEPGKVRALLGRGNVHLGRGEFNAAIRDYQEALDINPNYGDAYANRGTARKGKGDAAGALEDYDRALKCNPRDVNSYNNRGELRYLKGDVDGALGDFEKAIEINPLDPKAYNNRGMMRYAKKDFASALEDLEKSVSLDPKYADAWSNRGIVRTAQNNLAGALEDFSKAIELNPRSGDTYFNRGLIHQVRGELDEAKSDLEKALDLTPLGSPKRAKIERFLRDLNK